MNREDVPPFCFRIWFDGKELTLRIDPSILKCFEPNSNIVYMISDAIKRFYREEIQTMREERLVYSLARDEIRHWIFTHVGWETSLKFEDFLNQRKKQLDEERSM